METKKILPLALAGVGVYMLTQQQKGDGTNGTTPATSSQSSGGGTALPAADSQTATAVQIKGIITANSTPDYKTWHGAEWAEYWRALWAADSSTAADKVWQKWRNDLNPFRGALPSKLALVVKLATTKPRKPSTVGAAITWDAVPKYATFDNWYYSITPWTCAEWRAWHEALEDHYKSTSKANSIWLAAWQHSDNDCYYPVPYVVAQWGSLAGWLCPTAECASACTDFVEYFASKNINVTDVFTNVYCDLSSVVLNITEGAKQTSSLIGGLMPIAAAGLIGFVVYKATKK